MIVDGGGGGGKCRSGSACSAHLWRKKMCARSIHCARAFPRSSITQPPRPSQPRTASDLSPVLGNRMLTRHGSCSNGRRASIPRPSCPLIHHPLLNPHRRTPHPLPPPTLVPQLSHPSCAMPHHTLPYISLSITISISLLTVRLPSDQPPSRSPTQLNHRNFRTHSRLWR